MTTFLRSQASKDRPMLMTQAEAFAKATALVTKARLQFITDLPGQDAIYQAKENEAKDWLSGLATIEELPLLNAETGLTAPTANDLANLWIGMAQQWRNAAAQIEGARMKADRDLKAATNETMLNAALDQLETELFTT